MWGRTQAIQKQGFGGGAYCEFTVGSGAGEKSSDGTPETSALRSQHFRLLPLRITIDYFYNQQVIEGSLFRIYNVEKMLREGEVLTEEVITGQSFLPPSLTWLEIPT